MHNQKEYSDHVFQAVEYDTVLKEVKMHYAKIEKVKAFLLMCFFRRRHVLRLRAHDMIRRYLRGYVARRDVKEQLLEKREEVRVKQMELAIRRCSKTEVERWH